MRRRREYQLVAARRRGPFTTQSRAYPRWPYLYRVRAVSVKQAYWLAGHEVVATDAHALGVRQIVHHNDPDQP